MLQARILEGHEAASLLVYLHAVARRIVYEHAHQVDVLASALLQHEVLGGRAVNSILNSERSAQ